MAGGSLELELGGVREAVLDCCRNQDRGDGDDGDDLEHQRGTGRDLDVAQGEVEGEHADDHVDHDLPALAGRIRADQLEELAEELARAGDDHHGDDQVGHDHGPADQHPGGRAKTLGGVGVHRAGAGDPLAEHGEGPAHQGKPDEGQDVGQPRAVAGVGEDEGRSEGQRPARAGAGQRLGEHLAERQDPAAQSAVRGGCLRGLGGGDGARHVAPWARALAT